MRQIPPKPESIRHVRLEMVKAYQRFVLADNGTLGVVASTACTDVLWINGGSGGGGGGGGGPLALTASLNALILWNLRTGSAVTTMRDTDCDTEVSGLAADPSQRLVASGHQDGTVRLWDRASWTLRVALDGHRSAIASVAFSADGQLLASGSHDMDIIVWDCVAESGMFRLHGHKDAVTAVAFLPGEGAGRLVSGSKDSLVKVWDIDSQHCEQTLTGHRSEVRLSASTSCLPIISALHLLPQISRVLANNSVWRRCGPSQSTQERSVSCQVEPTPSCVTT